MEDNNTKLNANSASTCGIPPDKRATANKAIASSTFNFSF